MNASDKLQPQVFADERRSRSSIKADFDRLALLDDEGWTTNNHYHDFLLKHVPEKCGNALEIGCGTGAFARRLAERCRRVVALDLSAEMIRVARSRSDQLENLDFSRPVVGSGIK